MKAGFVGDARPLVELQPDGTWTLQRDVVYWSEVTHGFYHVPKGFNTDFASVPRLPFVYLVFGNTCHQAALLHDYLYRTGMEDRATCDRIFLEAMSVTEVAAWRRYAMYVGVRAAGAPFHLDTARNLNRVLPHDAPALVPVPGD